MAYGDYDGPNKPNKGEEGGACNRTRCQAEPALWYNHGMYLWYCGDCATAIGGDVVNYRSWMANWYPKLGHPQFETREEMDARLMPPTFEELRSSNHDAMMASMYVRDQAKALRQQLYEFAKLVPQYADAAEQASTLYLSLCQQLGFEPEPVFDLEAYMQTEHYQGIMSGRIR